jgi:hypothetical protein
MVTNLSWFLPLFGVFMADNRNRISVTLTDAELAEVKSLANLLGMKPTRVLYEAYKMSAQKLLDRERQIRFNIQTATQIKESLKNS